ncbi:MAG: N-6 DNA methylase [Desulfamplus sp.]|nr:N-6 DNA methylase [Desulfamplus sp.]
MSEIEETTARIQGIDVDKTKSKRKKDGIFYTPQYITQYIVENTIGKLCDEKRKELDINEIEVDESFHTKKGELSKKGNILYQKLEDYKDWLLTLKILDPACGSGAFLNQALSFLIKEHNFIIEIQTDLQKGETSLFNVEKAVLENNLYGVDINQESIEITKLSLWLRTAHKDRKLSDLSSNIRCGNSLIDDPEIAGDKAFNWEKEFSKVMQNGGFDVVIGNPPYGIIFELDIKKYLEISYPTFKRNNDLYIAFIHKSIELSKKGGYFSFITPNTYIRGDYFKILREHLIKKQIIEIVDFGNQSIFADANVFTAIICLQNTKQYSSWLMKSDLTTEKGYVKTDTNNFIAINELFLKLSKLEKFDKYLLVKDIGYNYWSKGRGKKRGQDSIGDRVFYSGKQKNSMDTPYLKGSQIKKYYNSTPQNFLKSNYKTLLNEEDTFRFTPEILETKPKIVYRQTSSNLIGTIDYQSYHTDKTVHTIIPRNDHKDSFDLKFILTLFNSKLLNYYYSILTEEAGKVFAQVKILYIKDLPIIPTNKKYQHPFIEKADIMLAKNKELQELKSDFFNFFKSELTPKNISKKLENWNELDWQQFKKEMEKCKVKDLSLKDRKDWQDYFIEHKEKADKLKSIIESTDREIDLMVYQLYGLTQKEIEIVENG